MIPLAAALAAGNRVMIKMSEFTPSTNRVLAKLLKEAFKEDQVAIVEGEADVASEFSHLPFNHLFFTGSTQVGKKVMEAASKNLVPVTLELGGKSPTIIDDQIDLTKAVDRFIFGKTLNSGQTCVAPDYILCPRSRVDELVAILKTRYSELYPTFDCNSDITSIINKRQFNRIQDALKQALESGAKVIPLADHNAETSAAKRKIPLTVVLDASAKSTIMNDEIFGPILPIVPYDNINDAIDFVSERERPLALYIYSFDKSFQNHVMRNTHAGSVAINDAAFQVAMEDLPFGGIGGSGMGKCHGHEGFLSFSHSKSVLKRGRLSFGSLLFPPYSNLIHKLVFKLFIR